MALMDTTSPLPRRTVSLFCTVGQDKFCSADKPEACSCKCHFDETRQDLTLLLLAYDLWRISSALNSFPEDERHVLLLEAIISVYGVVPFYNLSPGEVLARMEPTLRRSYWSNRETAEDFNIPDLH